MNRIYDKAVIDDLARHLSIPLPLAKQGAEEILAIVREGLMRDGVVNVTHLGTFRLKPVAARPGFNPGTRERIAIPAHQRVVFTPAKALRDQAEPPRLPSIAIVPEENVTPAVAAIAPVAGIPDSVPEPPPVTVTAIDYEVSIPAPEICLDREPSALWEEAPSPPAAPAPILEEPAAEALIPTPAAPERRTTAAPAAALRMNTNNTWAKRAPVIATIQPARTTTRRTYLLASVAAMLLGVYIAYQLNSAPHGASALPARAAVTETAPAAVAQETNFYFQEQKYQIVPGDSLWRIADVHYHEAVLWPHIYQANTATLANPDFLVNGVIITIPGLEGPPDKLSEADRRNIAQGYYLAYLFYQTTGRSDAPFALTMARYYDATVVDKVSLAP